jgi:ABC-type transport system substrate-binding protein
LSFANRSRSCSHAAWVLSYSSFDRCLACRELAKNRSTVILAFIAGKYDLTFAGSVTVPLMHDIQKQMPSAICESPPGSVSTNLIVNRDVPPFDDPRIRRALALTLDRQAFIDILVEGEGKMSGAMLPPPDGVWGMPQDMLKTIIGYGDVAKSREEARELMKQAGYSPDKRLKVKVSTRNIALWRDPATIPGPRAAHASGRARRATSRTTDPTRSPLRAAPGPAPGPPARTP